MMTSQWLDFDCSAYLRVLKIMGKLLNLKVQNLKLVYTCRDKMKEIADLKFYQRAESVRQRVRFSPNFFARSNLGGGTEVHFWQLLSTLIMLH